MESHNTLNEEFEYLLHLKEEYRKSKYQRKISYLEDQLRQFKKDQRCKEEIERVLLLNHSNKKVIASDHIGYHLPIRYIFLAIFGFLFLVFFGILVSFCFVLRKNLIIFLSLAIPSLILSILLLIRFFYIIFKKINFDEKALEWADFYNSDKKRHKSILYYFNKFVKDYQLGECIFIEEDFTINWVVNDYVVEGVFILTDSGKNKIDTISEKYHNFEKYINNELKKIEEETESYKVKYNLYLNKCKFIKSEYAKFEENLLGKLFSIYLENKDFSFEEVIEQYNKIEEAKRKAEEEKIRQEKLKQEKIRKEKAELEALYKKFKNAKFTAEHENIFKKLSEAGYVECMTEYAFHLLMSSQQSKINLGIKYLDEACNKGYSYACVYQMDRYRDFYGEDEVELGLKQAREYLSGALKISLNNTVSWRYGFAQRVIGIYYALYGLVHSKEEYINKAKNHLLVSKKYDDYNQYTDKYLKLIDRGLDATIERNYYRKQRESLVNNSDVGSYQVGNNSESNSNKYKNIYNTGHNVIKYFANGQIFEYGSHNLLGYYNDGKLYDRNYILNGYYYDGKIYDYYNELTGHYYSGTLYDRNNVIIGYYDI